MHRRHGRGNKNIENLHQHEALGDLLHKTPSYPVLRASNLRQRCWRTRGALPRTTGRAPVPWLRWASVSAERRSQPLSCAHWNVLRRRDELNLRLLHCARDPTSQHIQGRPQPQELHLPCACHRNNGHVFTLSKNWTNPRQRPAQQGHRPPTRRRTARTAAQTQPAPLRRHRRRNPATATGWLWLLWKLW